MTPSGPLAELLDRPPEQRRLGPFQLERQLGRGGFAPVWLASEVYDGIVLRSAAVKLFSVEGGAGSRYRERVVREARALCQVEHPNIVRFHSLLIDEQSALIGLSMEYLAGDSLADRVRDRGALGVGEALDVGVAVASALAVAHEKGIVHRDVKPANVMVTERGDYKLIDFGIATAEEMAAEKAAAPRVKRVLLGDLPLEILGTKMSMLADAHTLAHTSLGESAAPGGVAASGTVGYIDPVCVSLGSPASPASDLYSLGATLFECLTGKLPAVAASTTPGLRAEVLDGREPPPSTAALDGSVPPGLSTLIERLLSPEREGRPESASEVARELTALREAWRQPAAAVARTVPADELVGTLPTATPAPPVAATPVPAAPPAPAARRRPWGWLVAGAVGVVGFGVYGLGERGVATAGVGSAPAASGGRAFTLELGAGPGGITLGAGVTAAGSAGVTAGAAGSTSGAVGAGVPPPSVDALAAPGASAATAEPRAAAAGGSSAPGTQARSGTTARAGPRTPAGAGSPTAPAATTAAPPPPKPVSLTPKDDF